MTRKILVHSKKCSRSISIAVNQFSEMEKEYDVVIAGAGLAGLTSAYYLKKLNPSLKIVILERSGSAGGLSGNWIDHRLGLKKKLQMPMHMIFVEKYRNILNLVSEIGGTLSPRYTGYRMITSNGKRHRMEMEDWTAKYLPPPLHALGMFSKLNLSLYAKWDLFKLGLASSYCYRELTRGAAEPCLVPNTISFESFQLLLNMGAEARDFIETATPSIYNPHPWYTSAPRMAAVTAGTLMVNRGSLHYHVFGKNYNAAFIDQFVAKLARMGVEIRYWTEVRRIDSNPEGSQVDAVWYRSYGPESGGKRYVCENCGAENHALDRAFCTRCGRDTTLNRVRDGEIQKPACQELWMRPKESGCQSLKGRWFITAMYPHMISKLIPDDSPLRKQPYVKSFFSSRGNQTRLSIGRVYYSRPVTNGETFITGTHNPTFCFNGCQSVFNNFGGEDLDHHGDVIDVLLDVGVIQEAHRPEEMTEKIVKDLQGVYPEASPSLVEAISFAKISPDVLYLTEQPAITNLHRFFNTHQTGASNWFVAGCHSGQIGIGMESAVESGMSTVNQLFEKMGSPERVPVESYTMSAGSRIAATVGAGLLRWKGRGRGFRRLAS
ncbi:MAG: FAD-dependent oxidoreductase [Deltaproteobacteria bacterium]|nr:FAD-dependent oxidoreductase [Deltaproteobacteria bacterium]